MTKDELKGYGTLCKEYDRLTASKARIEKEIYTPSGITLDRMPRSSARKRAPYEEWVARKDRRLRRINSAIERVERQMQAIERAVQSLPPIEEAIITAHYLDGGSWEAVAELCGYSERHTRRFAERALERLKDVRLCPCNRQKKGV